MAMTLDENIAGSVSGGCVENAVIEGRERLLQAGLREAQLSRLHAPIGLDIGAGSPEEIALAVMAEVVEEYRKRRQFEVEHEAVLHPGND